MMFMAQTQTLVTACGHLIRDTAARAGRIPGQDCRTRLSSVPDAAHSGWTTTARTWCESTPPDQHRSASDLSLAAAETRAALHEITHDRAGPAAFDVIDARVDLANAADTIQQALSTGVELACVMPAVREAAHLTGPPGPST